MQAADNARMSVTSSHVGSHVGSHVSHRRYLRRSRKSSRRRSSLLSGCSFLSDIDITSREGIPEDIIFKENKALMFLRVMVIFMLVAAASIVAGLTYWHVSTVEKETFVTQYNDSVTKVAEGFINGVNLKVWSADSISAIFTSRYGEEDAWPNVTLPDFQQQAQGEVELAEARALSWNPIVITETRVGWEAYANGIIEENNVTNVADGIFRKVEGVTVYDPGYSPESKYPYAMVPVWQITPVGNEKAVFFNLHSETKRQRALDDMMSYKVPAMTAILQLVQDLELRPSSILFYPVFNDFNLTKVVGSISVVFSWDVVLGSLLPTYIKGITCVLETNIGQAYTYTISGGQATVIGEGDLHDSRYDDMVTVVNVSVADVNDQMGGVDHLVSYTLSIYPSSEFESQYITNKPLIFTLVVLAIFGCTSLTFFCYDYLIDNHLNVVMKAATNSSKIVQSLFPSNVRERLFNMNKEPPPKTSRFGNIIRTLPEPLANVVETPAVRMKSFLNLGTDNPGESMKGLCMTMESEPIADLFPATTIMFADIAGFTAWSSAHRPQDVFHLLESLFKEFDTAARKLGVFKVETIGDCYVAVAGLPDAREDHALVMAQFALECQRKMNTVKVRLDGSNGLGTEVLRLRSGLHSGQVTAGVLRGEKSRFQLFGDTMNTASRMESTGEPTRVQISQTTADLLREAGKESWFVEREGGVTAKGKGQMRTFWLHPNVHIREKMKEKRLRSSVPGESTQDEAKPNVTSAQFKDSLAIIISERKMSMEENEDTKTENKKISLNENEETETENKNSSSNENEETTTENKNSPSNGNEETETENCRVRQSISLKEVTSERKSVFDSCDSNDFYGMYMNESEFVDNENICADMATSELDINCAEITENSAVIHSQPSQSSNDLCNNKEMVNEATSEGNDTNKSSRSIRDTDICFDEKKGDFNNSRGIQ